MTREQIQKVARSLVPKLKRKFRLKSVEIGEHRIYFGLLSEENLICAQTAISAFIDSRGIPAVVKPALDENGLILTFFDRRNAGGSC